jgi:hypothetical protein
MSLPLVESIGENIYLWQLTQTVQQIPDSISSQVQSIAQSFVLDFFGVEKGQTEVLFALSKNCYQNLVNLIPNFKHDFTVFSQTLEQEFTSYHSELLTLKLERSRMIISGAKQTFRFASFVPQFVVRDLQLEEEEMKFALVMMDSLYISEQECLSKFIKLFKEFIDSYNDSFEKEIRELIKKSLQRYNSSFELIYNFTKNRVVDYLICLIRQQEYVKVEIKSLLLTGSRGNFECEENWVLISEFNLVRENIELHQIVKLSDCRLLITISLQNSEKMLLLEFNNFIVRIHPNLLDGKNAYIAKGSTSENLLIISNTLKTCYSAELKGKGIEIKKSIDLFSQRNANIISACYMKNIGKLLYVYEPGGVDQFAIKQGPMKNFANIIPQLYKDIFISECENFILLVSEQQSYLFNKEMKIIDIQKFKPLYFKLTGNQITSVDAEDSLFTIKSFSFSQVS